MTIVFFGNTKYSRIGAAILHEKLGISHVVTLPDSLDKKGNPIPGPVKEFAKENNIPVLETNKLTQEQIDFIAQLQPDFFVVEDYGLILPKRLLEIPKFAPLNIHHSLLPKYRGPAPAPSAILAGESISGVSIIHMNAKVDAGDIYAQETYALYSEETTDSLLTALNTLGGSLVVKVIEDIIAHKANPQKQDESAATHTVFMQKTDGFIDLNQTPSPEIIDRMIRAYYPWPTAWTKVTIPSGETKIVKLLPKKQLQMEGKKAMGMKDFFNGYPQLKQQLARILQ